ncbi:sensor histidine kinase [Microtetraspora malaysiensis]|uniref:sensor histidine kinase n=1 Tax=Microtetraspora malaysiensis TaxID=161358 RepID=UPI000A05F0E2|nr:histidine kinase [Microtetraspora malaysiensis]
MTGRLERVFTFGGAGGRGSRLRRLMGISFGFMYLAYPVSDIVTGEVSGAEAVWQSIALGAFVVTYIAAVLTPGEHGERGRQTVTLMALTTLMAVVFPLLFGGGWTALPIYVTVMLSMALPLRLALAAMAAMTPVVLADCLVAGAETGTVMMLLMQVWTLGILFASVRNTRMLVLQLEDAQREVARLAASDERLRIARDLHDLLGHSLSLIVLKSELAGRLAEQGAERAVHEIADIESVARQALVEVREAVTGYRRRGFAEELDGARAALAAAGLAVTARIAGTPLPDTLDGLFGWGVREAATNVVRHARATRCEITVTNDGTHATLEVTDNGVAGPYEPGSGLRGLAERVRAEGGAMEAGPSPGGFRLRIAVPAPHPAGPEDESAARDTGVHLGSGT